MLNRNASFLLIRISALLALGIVTFLTWQKSTGQISSIAGCGGEDGCAQVLGGRWSQWFGIPVTVLAACLYVFVILSTIRGIRQFSPTVANNALLAAGMLAMLAAIWFIGLLIFVEKAICPYCFATHACGFLMGVFIWRTRFSERNEFDPNATLDGQTFSPKERRFVATGFACLAITGLAIGQLFGPRPDTHEIVEIDLSYLEGTGVAKFDQTITPSINSVFYLDGFIQFDVAESPHVGNPLAPHVITEMFDYTCENCRLMHQDLKELEEANPGKFLVIISPCPLNKKCNRNYQGDPQKHVNACEYARLAWAFWRANPAKFAMFHEFLMTGESPPSLSVARAAADQLAGKEAMRIAAKDPWINLQFRHSTNNYGLIAKQNPRMPALLLGGTTILNGLFHDKEQFIQTIEDHFKIER